jgi:hypothetical protein
MRPMLVSIGAAAAVITVLTAAAPAQAAAPSHGCPAGYQVLVVADLMPLGYRVPTLVDEQLGSFGLPPNHNGLVCGVALGGRSFDGNQIYNFMDDSLPASG